VVPARFKPFAIVMLETFSIPKTDNPRTLAISFIGLDILVPFLYAKENGTDPKLGLLFSLLVPWILTHSIVTILSGGFLLGMDCKICPV
jgi:hypothetical protein